MHKRLSQLTVHTWNALTLPKWTLKVHYCVRMLIQLLDPRLFLPLPLDALLQAVYDVTTSEFVHFIATQNVYWYLMRSLAMAGTIISFLLTRADLKKLAEQLCLIESRRARNLGEWGTKRSWNLGNNALLEQCKQCTWVVSQSSMHRGSLLLSFDA